MTYLDRLRPAEYISPSGKTYQLQFDDVERSGGKKASIKELPQQNIASVQDIGNTARRYPMSIYFTGDAYDQDSDAFEAALSESGPGVLKHPRYGDIDVLPLTWVQTEKFVDGVGRADFKIEFIHAPPSAKYPLTATAISSTISIAAQSASSNSVVATAAKFSPSLASDIAAIKSAITSAVGQVVSAFNEVLAISDQIQSEVNAIVTYIETNIDTLINAPLELFTELKNLCELPGQIITDIGSKIESYTSILDSIFNTSSPVETIDQALSSMQTVIGLVSGVVIASTVGGSGGQETQTLGMVSRTDAVNASDAIKNIIDNFSAYISATETAIPGYKADADTVSALIDSLTAAKKNILEQSFSLKIERKITLQSSRTPLDLYYELFGDIAGVEDFIKSNRLTGDYIILIPSGRVVSYYV